MEKQTYKTETGNTSILNKFEFRNIKKEESKEAAEIESICFPPNEACSPQRICERIQYASELFLVAIDKENGKMSGFLNGLSTEEESFRDEFFTDAKLYNPHGKNIMILGLDVLPQYRGQGLARTLMEQYIKREQAKGREKLILTCHEALVPMYQKMGFQDDGIANSSWGGCKWHEMSCSIKL